MSSERAEGVVFQNRVVVWDLEWSRKLFRDGFYGKPLGLPKPKDLDFNAPLILDLIEATYLMQKGRLDVRDENGRQVPLAKMVKMCKKSYSNFEEKLLVYSKLRDSGFVVAPGIKFGSDFAVYEHGPGIDHAPYIVQVYLPDSEIRATEVVMSGRLATTVRKQFVIAIADKKRGDVSFLRFDWWRA